MKKHIGFSTGCCRLFEDPLSKEAISLIHRMKCEAIEINWHKVSDVPSAEAMAILKRFDFKRVSLHLPCDTPYDNGENIRSALHKASSIVNSYPFDYCLVHPDLVFDWRIFDYDPEKPYPIMSIENMDERKESFRNLQMILNFFKRHHHFKLVFDVNHWLANGNGPDSLPAALHILKQGDIRIAGIHLSGDGYHEPLFRSEYGKRIMKHISDFEPDISIPIIIESACRNVEEMEKELGFVRKNLQ